MSLFGLSSLVPAGLTAVAVQAADKLADGLSFAETLLRGDPAAETTDASDEESAAKREAQALLESKLADFRTLLSERLATAGIDLSSPLTLQDDGFGFIAVDGAHPNRAAIERLLAGDAELTAAFNALAADYARSSSSEADGFAATTGDGEATPYDRLLADIQRRGFRLTLHGESLTIDAE
jgi:hypothetical protein